MTARQDQPLPEGVDRLHDKAREVPVSEELDRLLALLRAALPSDAAISFLFDGHLRLRVDVRKIEEVMAIEMLLPTLGGGIFHGVQRGQAPNHSFMHRVTALVDR